MNKFYSNGKLLLTGEYVVLNGAKSFAIPTKFGQNLTVDSIKDPQLIWESFLCTGECWFKAVFDLPNLRLATCTFTSNKEENAEYIAETLQTILREAQKLNSKFLQEKNGFLIKTILTFPKNWGLGSSSTLINNIASWAKINPYKLLWNAFVGSGYDIACTQNSTPVFYQLKKGNPIVEKVSFKPKFLNELFFVHLNKKQNSREGIIQYKKNKKNIQKQIDEISMLSNEFLKSTSKKNIEKVIIEHEKIISSILKMQPIKQQLFSDYFGEIKSLGAWGGDFVLVTGNLNTSAYFKQKGFETVIRYNEMTHCAF